MATPDDGYATAVIGAVQDLTARLAEHTRTGDEARAKLLETVEHTVAALRTDVHKAITSLQLGQVDHKASHEADRIERVARQQQVDAQLSEIRRWIIWMLIGIVGTFSFLIGWLVF